MSSFVPHVCASTVAPMTLQSMADYAGQVVMGSVASVRSYWAEESGLIESEIILENVTFLKGAPAGAADTYTMIVPGGTVGTMRMELSCTPQFAPGRKWILFLLPEYKTFPVVGLSNGAFRIETDADGTERVLGATRHPVVGIDDEGYVRSAPPFHASGAFQRTTLVGSSNARLTTRAAGESSAPQAIALSEFLALLEPILLNSKHHAVTSQMGRRVPVTYTPAPLHVSPESGGSSSSNSVPSVGRSGGLTEPSADPSGPSGTRRNTTAVPHTIIRTNGAPKE